MTTVLLAGCAGSMGSFRADTAVMPLTSDGGPAMNQTEAIALASWALKDPTNTAGKPERAARAVAAEDWLAGQSMLTGEFGTYAPVNEWSWNVLRHQMRAAIGVPATAPSQELVVHLLAAADALQVGQTEAAMAQFTPPLFTLGPQRTLAALTNLPPLPGRAEAFYDLDRNDNRSPGNCGSPRMC